MRIKLLFFLVPFLCFLTTTVRAETFIVTSNADSGPGTLREALERADLNGMISGQNDSIVFNLPDVSEAGRTIKINFTLFRISSNIVLDATSQPGLPFGISDARIIIEPVDINTANYACFWIKGDSVQIYGFYLRDFANAAPDPNTYATGATIEIEHITNGKIGAPGKGNVISGTSSAISTLYQGSIIQGIFIKSNILGLEPDGKTIRNQKANNNGTGIFLPTRFTVEIGGNTPEEGNLIAGWRLCAIVISEFQGTIKIKNNKLGTDVSGANEITGLFEESSYQNDIMVYRGSTGLEISKNVIRRGITLSEVHLNFSISNNIIGTDILKTKVFQGGAPIVIKYSSNYNRPEYRYQMRIDSNNIAYQSRILIENSYAVTIRDNSIYCQGIPGIKLSLLNTPVPFVTINNYTSNSVSGTAPPLAKIQLFYDDECNGCNGKYIIDSTQADANGTWNYNNTGNFTSAVIVTATDAAGGTSEFSSAGYTPSQLTINNAGCNQKNGSITGMQISSGTVWHWEDENGTVVGLDTNLVNVGPGKYRFVIGIGNNGCTVTSPFYEVEDKTPSIDETNVIVTQPSCGLNSGSIHGLVPIFDDNFRLEWKNQNYTTVSNSPALTDVGEGEYRLIITDVINGCADSTDWFTLTNQSGPSLNINGMAIHNASCNKPNGSITNISVSNVTGTTFIQWLDAANNAVGNTLNLLNQPAGSYRLKFKDQSSCDTIVTPYYTISVDGVISLDASNVRITPAGCTINNGSIQNIQLTGADSWQWHNLSNNSITGNTIDIFLLTPGDYQMTASNSIGCQAASPIISVPVSSFAPIQPIKTTVVNAYCNLNNGSLKLEGFQNEQALSSYYWINSNTNEIIDNDLSLNGLGTGTYEFVAIDTNGCKQTIFKNSLLAQPKPILNESNLHLTDDQCSLQKGSITGLKLTGLLGPTTYTWINNNILVVSNSIDLINAPAGEYQLIIKDKNDCIIESDVYLLENNENAGIPASYDDMVVQRNATASLAVKNFHAGTYILYNDANGTQVIEQNTTGFFNLGKITDDKYYYVKHISGTCNSPLVRIKITAIDKSEFAIASAFTPNEDGLNDKLNLKVIGFIDVEYFKIYNRNGENVFATKTINDGWDGNLKGHQQPSGVFVWMAGGKDITGKTITAKGSFVLIR